jgi:hypothetical protein
MFGEPVERNAGCAMVTIVDCQEARTGSKA